MIPHSIRREVVRDALVRLAKTQGIIGKEIEDEDECLAIVRELAEFAVTGDRGEPKPMLPPALTPPDDLFASASLDNAQATRIALVRSGFTLLLTTIREALPAGRYRSLCESALETACMWATKGISRMARA